MTRRIGILAACASTLVLMQADLAQAGYGAVPGSRVPARTTETAPEPAIVLAQSAIVPSRSNIKRPTRAAEGGSALGPTRGRTLQPGEGGTKRTGAPAFGQPVTFTATVKPATPTGQPSLRQTKPALGDVNRDGLPNRTKGGPLPQLR